MKTRMAAVSALLLCACSPLISACGGSMPTDETPSLAVPTQEVVATVRAGASLAFPPTRAADLFDDQSVDLIVQGRVSRIEYRYVDEALAFTGLEISVNRSSTKTPAEITSWELGGLIPVSELPAFQRQKIFGDDPVPNDSLIDFAPAFGAAHPKIGDDVVLFLELVRSGPTAGDYNAISDTMGRFVRSADGAYLRAGTDVDGATSREELDGKALDIALTVTSPGK